MAIPPVDPNVVTKAVDFVTKIPDLVIRGRDVHRESRSAFWVMAIGFGIAIVAGYLVPDDNAVIMVPIVIATLVVAVYVGRND